jgi:DNA repair protein RecO (recombination protein O)
VEWTDEALVLGSVAYGEAAAVVDVLTGRQGRWRGLVRGGRSSRRHGHLEPGNRVQVTWRGRFADQLGSFHCELVRPVAFSILRDAGRLMALRSACALLLVALPPHDPQPRSYGALDGLLADLAARPDWAACYARWELDLLAVLGFGLDLGRCAAGSSGEELAYVSPRSGCAVGCLAGAPYRDKLLPLPPFLRDAVRDASAAEVGDALRLTGYFLERHLTEGGTTALPAARRALADRFRES